MDTPTKPLVFMAMPHYGGMVHAEAAKAFWCDAVDDSIDIINADHGSSLLANTFNDLWCLALNFRKDHAITHFAMLHADVAPERFWLKTLLGELQAADADLCAAVVPIKSRAGITSTAISSEYDDFRVERRLTINEVRKLPATFDAESCGYPNRTLLANTGCWVCRFDKSWVEDVHFEIRDLIVCEDGKYRSRVLPEDWNFSRQIWRRGGKIVCTSKVPIRHYGAAHFDMSRESGVEIDAMATAPLPALAKGFRFPADVEGWLSPAEGAALADLAIGKRVLEIGSFCGRSTICLAQTARSVVSYDPHDARDTLLEPRYTFTEFRANLIRYGVAGKVLSAATFPEQGPFEFIFIDGAHDADAVRADVNRAKSILAPGGLLAFHDYRPAPLDGDERYDPGVAAVVNQLRDDGAQIIGYHDTLAVVRLAV